MPRFVCVNKFLGFIVSLTSRHFVLVESFEVQFSTFSSCKLTDLMLSLRYNCGRLICTWPLSLRHIYLGKFSFARVLIALIKCACSEQQLRSMQFQ